jgi:hypothetical protein
LKYVTSCKWQWNRCGGNASKTVTKCREILGKVKRIFFANNQLNYRITGKLWQISDLIGSRKGLATAGVAPHDCR